MITLASDFGSLYPAAMAGVIYSQSDARVVDVTHDLPRQDVRAGAFWLREILPSFPPAVHVIVVDPGVRTDRRALVCAAGDHVLVGPDNGILDPVARRLAGTESIEWFAIDDADAEEHTFHGRDVFAPMAATVHDHDWDDLAAIDGLTPIDDPVAYQLPEPQIESTRACGDVLVVDEFGNCVTNVPGEVLDGCGAIRVDDSTVAVGQAFDAVDPGEPVVLVGTHGLVELAVNRGRGDDAFDVSAGDSVTLTWD